MKKLLYFIFIIFFILFTQTYSNEELFKKMEKTSKKLLKSSYITKNDIRVIRGNREELKKVVSYYNGREKLFIEIVYPEKEQDTSIFYTEDETWLLDKNNVIKIVGIENQRELFGSDITFEEFKTMHNLEDNYKIDKIQFDSEKHLVVDMKKKGGRTGAFSKIKGYIDKETGDLTKLEFYDKSLTLAKTIINSDFRYVDGIRIPFKKVIKNELINDYRTVIDMTDIKFNAIIPPHKVDFDNMENLLNSY